MTATVPRHPDDFYRTPPACTLALLAVERFDGVIWEPACGDGAISKVLESKGHDVFSTDLIDRGYGVGGLNFLETTEKVGDCVVTNPPFKLADEFALKAMDLGYDKVAMLLRLSWLEGEARRRKVFSKFPPDRVWVFSARQTLWHGEDPGAKTTGGTIAYAWFIWDRLRPSHKPELGWLEKGIGA